MFEDVLKDSLIRCRNTIRETAVQGPGDVTWPRVVKAELERSILTVIALFRVSSLVMENFENKNLIQTFI